MELIFFRRQTTCQRLCVAAACRRDIARARTDAERRSQRFLFEQTNARFQTVDENAEFVEGQREVDAGLVLLALAHFQRNHTDFFAGLRFAVILFQKLRADAGRRRQKLDLGIVLFRVASPTGALGRVHRTRARLFVLTHFLQFHQRDRVRGDRRIHHGVRAEQFEHRHHFAHAILAARKTELFADRYAHRGCDLHDDEVSLLARRQYFPCVFQRALTSAVYTTVLYIQHKSLLFGAKSFTRVRQYKK